MSARRAFPAVILAVCLLGPAHLSPALASTPAKGAALAGVAQATDTPTPTDTPTATPTSAVVDEIVLDLGHTAQIVHTATWGELAIFLAVIAWTVLWAVFRLYELAARRGQ